MALGDILRNVGAALADKPEMMIDREKEDQEKLIQAQKLQLERLDAQEKLLRDTANKLDPNSKEFQEITNALDTIHERKVRDHGLSPVKVPLVGKEKESDKFRNPDFVKVVTPDGREVEINQNSPDGLNRIEGILSKGGKFYVEPDKEDDPSFQRVTLMDINDPNKVIRGRFNPETGQTTDEQGNPLGNEFVPFSQSVQAGSKKDLSMTTSTQTAVEKDIIDIDTKLSRVNEIDKFETDLEELLTLESQFKAWGFDKLERINPDLLSDDQKEWAEKYNDFTATVANNLNRTIQELSGAAVTTQEAERLGKELPQAGDGVSRFKGKMKSLKRQLKAAKLRYGLLRAQGFDDASINKMMESGSSPYTSGGQIDEKGVKDAINKLGNKMINDGLSKEEAKSKLREMGLL